MDSIHELIHHLNDELSSWTQFISWIFSQFGQLVLDTDMLVLWSISTKINSVIIWQSLNSPHRSTGWYEVLMNRFFECWWEVNWFSVLEVLGSARQSVWVFWYWFRNWKNSFLIIVECPHLGTSLVLDFLAMYSTFIWIDLMYQYAKSSMTLPETRMSFMGTQSAMPAASVALHSSRRRIAITDYFYEGQSVIHIMHSIQFFV